MVRTFTDRQPSMIFRSKATKMPGVALAAMAKAQVKFRGASLRGLAMGTWEPVNTTGMGTFRSMKLIMEAV